MSAASLFARGLNHLLLQSPGVPELLSLHAGQNVRFDLIVQQLDFRIADDGTLHGAATVAPDALVRVTPNLLSRLPLFERDALRYAEYSGDAALLHTLDKVFNGLSWDVEADLAPRLGDIAAHHIHTAGRGVLHTLRQAAQSLQYSASEFVVEEIELIARKNDVRRYHQEVDTLVNDVARLEARLIRLETSPPQVRKRPK